MSVRLNGSTSGYVELDAPAVADNTRYEVPGDLGIPAGAVMQFAGNAAPAGWLKANGATISRTSYPRLWAWAATSGNLAASEGAKQAGQFGPGNGSTTFSLPDLRGQFVRGWDDSRGIDTGRALGTEQADDYKAHSHTMASLPTSYSTSPRGGTLTGTDVGGTGTVTSSTSPATGGTETRPRNVALLFCIKA